MLDIKDYMKNLVFLLPFILMCAAPLNYMWSYSRTDYLEEVKYLESKGSEIVKVEQTDRWYKIYYRDKE